MEKQDKKKSDEKDDKPVRLQIKASDDVAKGVYSNMALVHNNELEFVMDFVFMEPQRPQGHVVSRIVTNPKAAKKLLTGLNELVRRYEERFGEIKIPKTPSGPQGSYH